MPPMVLLVLVVAFTWLYSARTLLSDSQGKARTFYQVCLVEHLGGFLIGYDVPSTRSVSKILGEAIRNERIKAGLTQEQLAEKADLARNYIGNIERAEYKITVETLAKIAKALDLRMRDLLEEL